MAEQIAAPDAGPVRRSDMPPFLDAASWLAEHVPQARLSWLGPARHAWILEQPKAFAAQCGNS
jgi:hypothetical protein